VRWSYNSFLIRYWALDAEQGERAELTHLQSGERCCVASLAEALAWMRDHERGAVARLEPSSHGQPAGGDADD
jgi:hypothetical protein